MTLRNAFETLATENTLSELNEAYALLATANNDKLDDILEAVLYSNQFLSVLGMARNAAGALRVDVGGQNLGTLTQVTTVSNLASYSGYNTGSIVPAASNQIAIMSNIQNVIVT